MNQDIKRISIFTLIGLCIFLFLVILSTPEEIFVRPVLSTHAQGHQVKKERHQPSALFIDKTIELGFHTEHRQRDEKISGLDQVSGAGACTLDYDQDGWTDILVIAGSGIGHYFGKPKWWQASTGSVLYRNLEGRGFKAQTDALPNLQDWGFGCTVADFDNDGAPDLFLSNKGKNRLLKNVGGSFEEIPTTEFNDQDVWTSAAIEKDFDQDGLIDLYLVNYVDYSPDKHYLEEDYQTLATGEQLTIEQIRLPLDLDNNHKIEAPTAPQPVALRHQFSPKQCEIILAGGVIPWIKQPNQSQGNEANG